ncbi:hypothetical protein OAL09_05320 [Verrucomicrobia bacterium]|nr:hypothetical protein [Verrucomicrobiota bacterium]
MYIFVKYKFRTAAGIFFILFLFLHPTPHYIWVKSGGGVERYQNFVERFPSSDLADQAREKIRIWSEEDVWDEAIERNQIDGFRNYLKVYPDGYYINEAEAKSSEIADDIWEGLSASRSEDEIREFIREYPETSQLDAVEVRIQELYNDWSWVRVKDDLQSYKRFAMNFPEHAQMAWINKRIIDLEVREIASGKYGALPKAQPVSGGGAKAMITIKNNTSYTLTIRYSGPDSKKVSVSRRSSTVVNLIPGAYKVAASVDAANVTNYYGERSLKGGKHNTSYYIETSSFRGF